MLTASIAAAVTLHRALRHHAAGITFNPFIGLPPGDFRQVLHNAIAAYASLASKDSSYRFPTPRR